MYHEYQGTMGSSFLNSFVIEGTGLKHCVIHITYIGALQENKLFSSLNLLHLEL